jgi:glyoxylase-like metal-dependent hydrolase (beta-lactamase superfamily II)
MKFWSIESNRLRLDGGSMFGNAPRNLWEKWCAPDEQNRIELASRTLLLQTDDGRNVLFETGIGSFFEPKLKQRYGIKENEHMLLSNLAKAGFLENDIHIIILSHLHFDHAGGLLSSYGDGPMRLLFPKAQIFVGKSHWERALHPHAREKASFIPELHRLLERSGRLTLIENSTHPALNFGVSFYRSDGHTIGLLVSLIENEDGPIAFASDLVPGVPWINLPITMGYDRFSELTVDEKKILCQFLHSRQGKLFFTHDSEVDYVSITQQEDGKYAGVPFRD